MKDGLSLKKIAIIPTGDEILNGTVIDTNSPAILYLILKEFPSVEVKRFKPVLDIEDSLSEILDDVLGQNYDMIIFIGGSGGGHRFVDTLAKDFVSDTIIRKCEINTFTELYGLNGHLWSKLVVGKNNNSWVFNVPGPYKEATSAAEALIAMIKINSSMEEINFKMAEAVKMNYG